MEGETALEVQGELIKGSMPREYAHDAAAIVHFMSQFMTLSEGDQWIQGPLVASRLPKDANSFVFHAGDLSVEAAVE